MPYSLLPLNCSFSLTNARGKKKFKTFSHQSTFSVWQIATSQLSGAALGPSGITLPVRDCSGKGRRGRAGPRCCCPGGLGVRTPPDAHWAEENRSLELMLREWEVMSHRCAERSFPSTFQHSWPNHK